MLRLKVFFTDQNYILLGSFHKINVITKRKEVLEHHWIAIIIFIIIYIFMLRTESLLE